MSFAHGVSCLTSIPLRHLLGYVHRARYVLARRKRKMSAIEHAGFDIVTVACSQDLFLLRLQARSLSMYLDPAFAGNIVLIINDLEPGKLIRRIGETVLREYGRWQNRVTIVPFHHLGHGLDPTNGWKIQQALKLAVSTIVSRPFYVVLDCKNHLVRRVRVGDFVTKLGLARQKLDADVPTLGEHFRASAQLLGLRPEDVRPCWPMTPFVFHTQTVRDLIKKVEYQQRCSIFSTFRRVRLLSEFLLYKAHLHMAELEGTEARYEDGPLLCRTVWPGQSVTAAIASVERNSDLLVFGIHRDTLRTMPEKEKLALNRFWHLRGLVDLPGTADNKSSAAFRTPTLSSALPASTVSYL